MYFLHRVLVVRRLRLKKKWEVKKNNNDLSTGPGQRGSWSWEEGLTTRIEWCVHASYSTSYDYLSFSILLLLVYKRWDEARNEFQFTIFYPKLVLSLTHFLLNSFCDIITWIRLLVGGQKENSCKRARERKMLPLELYNLETNRFHGFFTSSMFGKQHKIYKQ